MALTPSEAIAEEKAISYIDQLRGRIIEVQAQLNQLDSDLKAGRIAGDDYVAKRQGLKQLETSLREELQRMGVVTYRARKIRAQDSLKIGVME